MATLSKSEYDKYLKQIQDAQKQVNAISNQVNKPAPSGQVLGASTQGLNAAQMGGASGVGFEDEATQTAISGQVQSASEQGLSKSQAGNAGGAPSTMSKSQADYAVRGAGLSGIIDSNKFVGMNSAQAAKAIQAEKAKRAGQVTSNVSFAFNPETIAGTKKIVDRVGIGINDITKQAWEGKGTQQDKIKATLDASAKQIASLFQSQEEYNNAVASNPQLQQTLQTFERLGGNAQDIASKIATPVTREATYIEDSRMKAVAGLMRQGVTDPNQILNYLNYDDKGNKHGDFTISEVNSFMQYEKDSNPSTADYLSTLSNPQANQEAQKKAMDELIPEKAIIQQEIARQQGIAEDTMALYFGTEEQVGIVEMKKNQAIEEKRIIEQKEKDEKMTLKAKAKLAIAKGRAELNIQTSKIEENRLAAKNYMTGMLAKLGALKTTGAAPLAIQTLDTKYEIARTNLENQYKYAEQGIEIELDDALNTLETDTDEQILKLEQDLTKDYEDITKEVMKLQQAADRETYNLTIKYASKLRERTTSYTKALKAEAEKYAKAFAKTASSGLDLNSLSNAVEGQYVAGKGVLNPLGGFNKLGLSKSQETEVANANLQGTDAVKYFTSLAPAERRLVMQTAQETGKPMTFPTIRDLIAQSRVKPEKKTTNNTSSDEEETDFSF